MVKFHSYSVEAPIKGITKQWCILGHFEGDDGRPYVTPIVYLQRPKYIKDDQVWDTICKSISLNQVSKDLEIK